MLPFPAVPYIVFDQYVRGVSEETAAKNAESVHCRQFSLGRFGPSCSGHRWELTILHYHGIMVIYPYPFVGGNYPIVLLNNIH